MRTEIASGVPISPNDFDTPRIVSVRLLDVTLGPPEGRC
jgi:hypothetical protein